VAACPPGAAPVEAGARDRSPLEVGARGHSPLPALRSGSALASASGGGWDWELGNRSLGMAVG
jgi:hypothetical protein